MVSISTFYLTLSAILFCMGVLGVLIRRNAIIVFMCVELMLNAVNISLVTFSNHFGVIDGHIYVIFVMAVAAAEASVGLAIILSVFRNHRSVDVSKVNLLRG